MSYREEAVANINDLMDGEMKQVTVDKTDILLSRINGNYYAINGQCSHYGAPLAKGALCDHKVICPWHHACFDVTTGKHLEAPGLDGLTTYEVMIKGEEVVVRLPEEEESQVTPVMGTHHTVEEHTLIVGGGIAALHAAQAMRELDYPGKITIVTAEADLPYDRTALSKKFLQDGAGEEDVPLRSSTFYEKYDIQVLQNKLVTRLDADAKSIVFEDGESLSYDKALLCTGGKVKKLEVPGADFRNVYTLRSFKDGRIIKDVAKGAEKVVVVGASFIGMECATSLQKLGCKVTVISPDKYPFASKWGEPVGKMIKELHEDAGIIFKSETKLKSIEGDTKAKAVTLDNGEQIETDLVIAGIGVTPATDYLLGIEKAEDGGIPVNQYLYAGKDIYAAGDIAQFEYEGNPVRIEHWRLASQQGKVAGSNLTGKEIAFDKVPFFWTAQQGKNIRYVGFVKDYDQVIYEGSVESQEFLAFYIKGDKVEAVLGMNKDPELAAIEHLMAKKEMPAPQEIKENSIDWLKRLQS